MTDTLRDRIAAVILEAYPGNGLWLATRAANRILAMPGIAVTELNKPPVVTEPTLFDTTPDNTDHGQVDEVEKR